MGTEELKFTVNDKEAYLTERNAPNQTKMSDQYLEIAMIFAEFWMEELEFWVFERGHRVREFVDTARKQAFARVCREHSYEVSERQEKAAEQLIYNHWINGGERFADALRAHNAEREMLASVKNYGEERAA